MKVQERLARNIRYLCEKQQMSFYQVAERAQIDRITIYSILKCKQKKSPHRKVIDNIASVLHVTSVNLLTMDMWKGEKTFTRVENIWRNVENYCEENAISLATLARKAGLHKETIYEAKRNNKRLLDTTLQRLAEAMDQTIEQLETYDGKEECNEKKYEIGQLCEARGKSLKQLEEEANIAHVTLINALEGKAYRLTYLKIAKALGVPVEQLLIPPRQE